MSTDLEENNDWQQVPTQLSHIKQRIKHSIALANASKQLVPERDIEAMTIAISEAEKLIKEHGLKQIPHHHHDRDLIHTLEKLGSYIATDLVTDPVLGCLLRGHQHHKSSNDASITASDVSWSLLRFSPSILSDILFGKKSSASRDNCGRGFADAQFRAHFLPWINCLALSVSKIRAAYRTWILIYLQTIKAQQSIAKVRRAAGAVTTGGFDTQVTEILDLFDKGIISIRSTLSELAHRDEVNEPLRAELTETLIAVLGQLTAMCAVTEDHTDTDLNHLVLAEQQAVRDEVAKFAHSTICQICDKAYAHIVWKCCSCNSCLGCLNKNLNGWHLHGGVVCYFCHRSVKLSSRSWVVVPVIGRILKSCLRRARFWGEDPGDPKPSRPPGICTVSTASMCTASEWDAESESIVAAVLDTALRD